jgi:hypothetical protein
MHYCSKHARRFLVLPGDAAPGLVEFSIGPDFEMTHGVPPGAARPLLRA